jgi:hypothetical protein
MSFIDVAGALEEKKIVSICGADQRIRNVNAEQHRGGFGARVRS